MEHEADIKESKLNSLASYRKAFEDYGCFNPECASGLELEVHHIIPRAKGGKDEYENFIILCRNCHRNSGNHSNYSKRMSTLYTWKFYAESKHRGFHVELSSLPKRNPESEEAEGDNRSKVLQFPVSECLPQSAKDKAKYSGVRKRTKRIADEISPVLAFQACPICEGELGPRQKFCSDKCRWKWNNNQKKGAYRAFAEMALSFLREHNLIEGDVKLK